jgi:hypothetical protein
VLLLLRDEICVCKECAELTDFYHNEQVWDVANFLCVGCISNLLFCCVYLIKDINAFFRKAFALIITHKSFLGKEAKNFTLRLKTIHTKAFSQRKVLQTKSSFPHEMIFIQARHIHLLKNVFCRKDQKQIPI